MSSTVGDLFPIANLDMACRDRFRAGDCLVIDVTNSEPEEGALLLRRSGVGSLEPRLDLVEALPRTYNGKLRWWLRCPGFFFADGPFDHDGENAWYLRSKIVGRVVGYVTRNALPDKLEVSDRAHPAAVRQATSSRSGVRARLIIWLIARRTASPTISVPGMMKAQSSWATSATS